MTENGVVSTVSIDFENHQLVCADGTRLTLLPIPKLVLERLYNDTAGKPKIPIVEVTIGGQYKRNEPNPEDPAYKQALDEWQSAKNIGLARYLVIHGVAESAPDDFADEYRSYSPGMSDFDLKYLWVLTRFGPDDATQTEGVKVLSEAITGQTVPTAEGLEKAEANFPRDGSGQSDHAVPVGEAADQRDVQPGL
jgi:hypothetical protein